MNKKQIRMLMFGAIVLSSGVVVIAASNPAVGPLHVFEAGTPIVAKEVNENFATLNSSIDTINQALSSKQNRVNGECADGSAIRIVKEDGTVVCAATGATGPQGPKGDTGDTGASGASGAAVVSTVSNATTVTATCPSGKVALGGGGNSSTRDVLASYPNVTSGAATAWTIRFSGASSTNTAYVICAS